MFILKRTNNILIVWYCPFVKMSISIQIVIVDLYKSIPKISTTSKFQTISKSNRYLLNLENVNGEFFLFLILKEIFNHVFRTNRVSTPTAVCTSGIFEVAKPDLYLGKSSIVNVVVGQGHK